MPCPLLATPRRRVALERPLHRPDMEPMDLPSINESDLPLAMERNLAEHACHLHRNLESASVTETGDLLIADSGLADDTFNIVAAANFAPDTAPARAAETARTLAATGRPFSWWVGPASTPGNLAEHLAEHLEAIGLEASETETGMGKDLRGPLPDAHVDGLEILPATTPQQLADYATVLAANWNPPAVRRHGAPILRRRRRLGAHRRLPRPLPGRLCRRPSLLLGRGLLARGCRRDLQHRHARPSADGERIPPPRVHRLRPPRGVRHHPTTRSPSAGPVASIRNEEARPPSAF